MKLFPHEYEFWKAMMVAATRNTSLVTTDPTIAADNAVVRFRERVTEAHDDHVNHCKSEMGVLLGLSK